MSGKVVDIRAKLYEKSKRKNLKKHIKINKAKEMAKFLIDYAEGDFAIVFDKESIKSLFDNADSDFVVAMTDIEKRNWDHREPFFKNFLGDKTKYFDLEGKNKKMKGAPNGKESKKEL